MSGEKQKLRPTHPDRPWTTDDLVFGRMWMERAERAERKLAALEQAVEEMEQEEDDELAWDNAAQTIRDRRDRILREQEQGG